MIYQLRQGWRIYTYTLLIVTLVFSGCEVQPEEDYFEDDHVHEGVEDYEDPDAYADEAESVYQEDEYDYGDFRDPPEPEIASVPPVGDVVSDEKWAEITEGVSFERSKKEKPKEKEDKADDASSDSTIPNRGVDFGKGFETGLSTIAWVIVVALIIGVLAWFIIRTKVDTSVDKVRDFSLTDELLAASKEELADALSQNLNNEDFQAAIRYRFGQLLQEMRKKGLLIWVPGRTNAEYQRALQDPFSQPFGVLAEAFSYALYSGKETTRAHYDEFASNADQLYALFSQLSPKPKVS